MNLFASRLPVLKFLGTFAGLQIGYTFLINGTSQSVFTIDEYMESFIHQKVEFTLAGIIKPRSIQLTNGLDKKFIMTDYNYDIKCKFVGQTAGEFKQGETAVISGYCPNIQDKNYIIVKNYFTKHSMETLEWDSKNNVSKKSYGLQSFK